MIKRLIILLLVIASNIACIATLEAQSFPLTVHAEWNPNPATEEVSSYQVSFNGGAPLIVVATSCTSICKSTDFTVQVAGPASVTVVAVNQWGSSAPATASVVISVPGKSSNVKITK